MFIKIYFFNLIKIDNNKKICYTNFIAIANKIIKIPITIINIFKIIENPKSVSGISESEEVEIVESPGEVEVDVVAVEVDASDSEASSEVA